MLGNAVAAGTGPVFIVEPPSRLDFSINRSKGVVIDCLVHGDPDPIVSWLRPDGSVITNQDNISGRYFKLLPNNSLVFVTIGNYGHPETKLESELRCKASNKYGSIVSRPVHINAGKNTFSSVFIAKRKFLYRFHSVDMHI